MCTLKVNETRILDLYTLVRQQSQTPGLIIIGCWFNVLSRSYIVAWQRGTSSGCKALSSLAILVKGIVVNYKKIKTTYEFTFLLLEKVSQTFLFLLRDIAPEGENLEETNANLDQLTDLAHELQEKTGVKLLWATCNLFANPRYYGNLDF